MENENSGDQSTDKTDAKSPSLPRVGDPVRNSGWQASQVDEESFREERCGEFRCKPRDVVR